MDAEVQAYLTETEVYVKYGLRDKALEHLGKIFELAPNNVSAHEKMRDIYRELGDAVRAAESEATLINIYDSQGLAEQSQEARHRLALLDPGHPLLQSATASQDLAATPQSTDDQISIDILEDPVHFEDLDIDTGEFHIPPAAAFPPPAQGPASLENTMVGYQEEVEELLSTGWADESLVKQKQDVLQTPPLADSPLHAPLPHESIDLDASADLGAPVGIDSWTDPAPTDPSAAQMGNFLEEQADPFGGNFINDDDEEILEVDAGQLEAVVPDYDSPLQTSAPLPGVPPRPPVEEHPEHNLGSEDPTLFANATELPEMPRPSQFSQLPGRDEPFDTGDLLMDMPQGPDEPADLLQSPPLPGAGAGSLADESISFGEPHAQGALQNLNPLGQTAGSQDIPEATDTSQDLLSDNEQLLEDFINHSDAMLAEPTTDHGASQDIAPLNEAIAAQNREAAAIPSLPDDPGTALGSPAAISVADAKAPGFEDSGDLISADAPPQRLAAPPLPPVPTSDPAVEETHADLSDELEEVDFLVEADLWHEARDLLSELLLQHPTHPDARALLERIEAHLEAELEDTSKFDEVDVSKQAANGSADLFSPLGSESDISSALGSAMDALQSEQSIPQVLPTPEAVDQDGLSAEDRYDQGMAFKEIGRLDEAIAEFEAAAASAERALDSLEMLGHCLAEKKDLKGAIEAFEQALEMTSPGPAANNLRYEIGATYEVLDDIGKAVEWFQSCYAADPHHRDVEMRLLSLGVKDLNAPRSATGAGFAEPPEPTSNESIIPSVSKKSKISYI